MIYTTDAQTIQKILIDRTSMEQEIALALSKEFNTGELLSKIKVAVWASFIFLSGLKQDSLTMKTTIEKLEVDNKFLFPSNAQTVEAVCGLWDIGETLTAEQCGNFIRFYGEVIDTCKDQGVWFRKERAKQIAARYGGGGEAFKASLNSSYVAKADTGTVWQKIASEKRPGGRIRIKAKDDSVGRDFFHGKVNPFYDLIPGNLFESDALKSVNVGKKFGGVMVWQVTDTSTIGKIDRTFGLPYGADISGTTTDNIYFLTGWADVSKGDPLVMMLPLAAIIGEYHHSLLEVAGAMSLKKVISYSIGFYSTLLPKLPNGVSPMSQRKTIEGLLKGFEEDIRNVHILLHYNGPKIAGCFIAQGDEVAAFKRLATIDIRLWPKFNAFPSYPGEQHIMQLLGEEGLVNAALASKRGALRPMGSTLHGWEKTGILPG